MKRIILCADDYGQNTAISQAIIDLIKKNRLSATSCMTTSYYWLSHAKWLESVKDQVDLGLHFNLTEGKPLTTSNLGSDFKSLSELILNAYLGKLDKESIQIELNAQIDQFESGIGRLPDYIDGHQHIQQLPIIRDIVCTVYDKRLRQAGAYIRSVYDPGVFGRFQSSGYIKALIIQLCGARAFKKALDRQNIPHNSTFAGVYDFNQAKNYARIFSGFLQQIEDKGIVMCHPGLSNDSGEDAIAQSRYLEFQFLQSEEFDKICAKFAVKIGRFK